MIPFQVRHIIFTRRLQKTLLTLEEVCWGDSGTVLMGEHSNAYSVCHKEATNRSEIGFQAYRSLSLSPLFGSQLAVDPAGVFHTKLSVGMMMIDSITMCPLFVMRPKTQHDRNSLLLPRKPPCHPAGVTMCAEKIRRNEKSFGDSSRDRIAISQRHPSVARSSTSWAQEGESVFGIKVVAFVKTSSSLLTITGSLQDRTANDNSSRAFPLSPNSRMHRASPP